MPYPTKALNTDEEVLVDLHPHWATVIIPTTLTALTALVWLALFVRNSAGPVEFLAAIAALVSLSWALIRWAGRITTHFVVTSDRVIYKSGVITRSGVEIPLEKVNNVNFRQSLFERIIGAGDLLIESGGEAGAQRFEDIPKPSVVQNKLAVAIENNDRSRYMPHPTMPTAAAPTGAAEQLRWLHELHDSGVLTNEDLANALRRLSQP
jgi:uncharacterized membrane protein YdbT with pleckstrin-like domain